MELDVTTISCERCRRRKIKCDRRQPCSKCRKADVTCQRASSNEKQRPVPKSYVQALESQVASLEIFIHKLGATSDEKQRDQMLSDFINTDHATTIGGQAQTQTQQPQQLRQQLTMGSGSSAVAATGEQVGEEVLGASNASVTRARAGQLRKTRAGDGSAHFYGGTSLFHIHLSDVPAADIDDEVVVGAAHSQSPLDDAATTPSVSWDSSLYWPATGTSTAAGVTATTTPIQQYAPHDDVPQRLMAEFFTHQYQYNMYVYREYFLRDYDTGGQGRYYSDLLLWAICAVGAAATSEPALSDIFIAQAQPLLFASLDSPNLTLLQSLILLGQLEIGRGPKRGSASRGWLYCGMAFRLAHEMGLHLDPDNWVTIATADNTTTTTASATSPPESSNNKENNHGEQQQQQQQQPTIDIDREILRRVYWGAFIADKQLSLYFGRPPALYPRESDVLGTVRIPYPLDWTELLDTYIAPGTSVTAFEDGKGLIMALGARAELAQIVHGMITDVFENRRRQGGLHHHDHHPGVRPGSVGGTGGGTGAGQPDSAVVAATIGRIHVSLTKWLAGLPSRLHWNQWTIGQLPPFVYHLHFVFHTIMIILHRPPRQLVRGTTASSTASASASASDTNNDDIQICYASLAAILRLLRTYPRYYKFSHLPLDFVHTLSTAAGTILVRRHSEDLPWDDAETSRSLGLVLSAMESIQDTWLCVGEIYQSIVKAQRSETASLPDALSPVMGFDFFNADFGACDMDIGL